MSAAPMAADTAGASEKRLVRYSYRERAVHWMAGLSYVYLLLTGLAFWSPWLFWIAVVLGGGTISRIFHPWAGVVFTIAVVLMAREWASEMHTTDEDRAFWKSIRHYTRNEDDEVPAAGRFNAGQKLLFWGFFWCGILLLLSGLILWLPHWVPWSLRFLRFVAVIVHAVAALLTIGLFIIHVYMGTAVEREAIRAMTRGDVSAGWARRYHRLWYERSGKDAPLH